MEEKERAQLPCCCNSEDAASFIPPDVISYYKQFGFSDEELVMFFKSRPSAAASYQQPELSKEFSGSGG